MEFTPTKIENQKEADETNAENPTVVDESAEVIVEGRGLSGAKDRVMKHLTVLNTVHATLKSIVNQLDQSEEVNAEMSQKLELAGQQLDSVEKNF